MTPSIHPEIPETSTYYINKPSQNVEAPLPAFSTFSGQIPCTDNSCGGETQKGILLSSLLLEQISNFVHLQLPVVR